MLFLHARRENVGNKIIFISFEKLLNLQLCTGL